MLEAADQLACALGRAPVHRSSRRREIKANGILRRRVRA